MLVAAALAFGASSVLADMPPNVRCAIGAQEKARNGGSDYQQIYKRNFELCMLNAMPREQQTTYLIEKLKPYEVVSPGPERQITSEEPKFTGIWVRLSPNHWVLQGD